MASWTRWGRGDDRPGIDADAFERMDFTFFAGSEDLTRKHWRQALRAGSTVLT